jgi:hypothetical protein
MSSSNHPSRVEPKQPKQPKPKHKPKPQPPPQQQQQQTFDLPRRAVAAHKPAGNPSTPDLIKEGIAIRDFAVEAEIRKKKEAREEVVRLGQELQAQGVHVRDFAYEALQKAQAEKDRFFRRGRGEYVFAKRDGHGGEGEGEGV